MGASEPSIQLARKVLLAILTSSVEARPQYEPRLPGRQGGLARVPCAQGKRRETGVSTSVSDT